MDELNRQDAIHAKGFEMMNVNNAATEYGRIKSGTKTLDDAVLNLGYIQKGYRKARFYRIGKNPFWIE